MGRKKVSRKIIALSLAVCLLLVGTVNADAKGDSMKSGTQAQAETSSREERPESQQAKEQQKEEKLAAVSRKEKAGALQWTEVAGDGKAGIEAQKAPKPQGQEYKDTQEVRVFIEMEGNSALEEGFLAKGIGGNQQAQQFSRETEARQDQVVEQILHARDMHPVEVHYQFSMLANAVSATVQYGDIERIKQVDGVKDVYLAPQYHCLQTAKPNTITAGRMVGSYKAWDSGYTGMGQRIAIIDSGIDEDHPSFDPGAFTYGQNCSRETAMGVKDGEGLMDAEDIAKVFGQLKIAKTAAGVSPKALYRNKKIAYGYNYESGNLDISHELNDHGTCVAGIAAANQYVPNKKGGYEEQPEGVSGIAPNAQLLVMKVLGKEGGAYSDNYMAAVEDALLLGADVMNISLGTDEPGESMAGSGEKFVNKIFARLKKSDVVVSISAGNNGAWAQESAQGHNLAPDVNMNALGIPGSYTNALTVASAINAGYTGCGFQFGKRTYFYEEAEGQERIAPMASLDINGNGTDYEYVYLDSVGEEQDYSGVDVQGKIVFVNQGWISYAQKHENAQRAGAAALFICCNDYNFPKLKLNGSKAEIPCAMLGSDDSWTLKQAGKKKVIRILSKPVPDHKAVRGYRMSSFSSWGVPGDLALKPEITAPGEYIYSAMGGGGYEVSSGTSMAAPSVAGMCALVSEYIQRNKLEEKTGLSSRTLVQSLLMSTAIPLREKDKEEYSPRKQGSGLANVEAATKTPAYLLVGAKKGNDGKVKAELGDDPGRKGEYVFSFSVHNLSGKNQYYTFDSSILTEQILKGKWVQGSSHKLQPQVAYSSESQVYLYDLNGDQRVDKEDAAALLRHVNESASQQRVEQNQDKFDFNGDGIVNTVDVYCFLQELANPTVDFTQQALEVKESAKVTVKVNLSEQDRNYLDQNFKHGMYIDGFVYLKGPVDLSIPMLAFYGNWTEASMFEPFDYLEFANGTYDADTYSGVDFTNYLNYYTAEEDSAFCYGSNQYLEGGDKEYLPDRNAFSTKSGDRIESIVYTLIRNAAVVETSIVNDKTGEVYYKNREENVPGAYYGQGEGWFNQVHTSVLDWQGRDKKGKLLPEGTRVRFIVQALPEYYKDKPKQAAEGTSFSVPMTIDNTKPQLVSMKDQEPGKIQLTIQDNRYTAAVKVYGRDQKTLLKAYGVNQKKPGAAMKLTIKDPKKVFYLKLVDYAGNTVSYRVNRSPYADTIYADGITLNQTELTLIKGNSVQLKASVTPESILDDSVTWASEDPSVAKVDKKGMVTGVSPGTTRILAVANAQNEAGGKETALCKVTVEEISVSLDAVIWSSEGGVYFSNFNTAKLPEYTRLSKRHTNYYSAAVAVEDKIFATVENAEDGSELYLIDPAKQYKPVLQGTLDWRPADLAYGPESGVVFGVAGTALHWFESQDLTTFEGVMDMDDMLAGDKLVGITSAGSSQEVENGIVEWYYLVTMSGGLYHMGYNVSAREFVYPDILKTLGDTGINTGDTWSFNSLCYDPASGYIFWSVMDGNYPLKLYALTYDADNARNPVKADVAGVYSEEDWPVILYSPSMSPSRLLEERQAGQQEDSSVESQRDTEILQGTQFGESKKGSPSNGQGRNRVVISKKEAEHVEN